MSEQTIAARARLEATAVLDRLTARGETFSRADAQRLIELIPVSRPKRFSFIGTITGRGSSFNGHAAGVGNVEMKEEAREKQISLNTTAEDTVGGSVVTHTPGRISIQLMWSETKLDESGQACSLRYDVKTSEPQEMGIAVQRTLDLLVLSLAYVTFVAWKRPEAA